MKVNYFFKHALIVLVALFGVTTVFSQTPKIVTLEEIEKPVVGTGGEMEGILFSFQAAAAWGDYNNDGYLDLITCGINLVPNSEGGDDWVKTTRLYKNNGDGTFAVVEHPFPGLDLSSITWIDYDNDGNLDVFLTGNNNEGRYSGMWHNLGPESNYEFEEVFEAEFTWINSGGGSRPCRHVAAGDFNNDGWTDLVMLGTEADDDSYTVIYRNMEGLYFRPVTLPVDGKKPLVQMRSGSVAWGDYNNDGYLDLAAFGYIDTQDEYGYSWTTGGAGAIYTNNGDGTFSEPYIFPAGEDGEVAWGDYNNDGLLDFAVTGFSWFEGVGWQGDLFHNNGDGTFERYPASQTGLKDVQGSSLAWGDLNNDGFQDLGYSKAEDVAVFYNNYGDSNFTRENLKFGEDQENINYREGTICFVDYDRDNNLDIFLNGYDDRRDKTRLMKNKLGEGIQSNEAPTVPTNLKVVTEGDITTFSWDASTDDITPKEEIRYNLYVKQGDVTKMVLPADLETGRLKVNETLAPITSTSYKMSGLKGEFSWGVQAIDNAKVASRFAKFGETGISTITSSNIQIIPVEGGFIAKSETNDTVTISDITGRVIAKGITNENISVPSKGIFLITVAGNTYKVLK